MQRQDTHKTTFAAVKYIKSKYQLTRNWLYKNKFKHNQIKPEVYVLDYCDFIISCKTLN
jgi:hypothetical protein